MQQLRSEKKNVYKFLLPENFWTASHKYEQSSNVLQEYNNDCELVNTTGTIHTSVDRGGDNSFRDNNQLGASRTIWYYCSVEKYDVINGE